MRKNVEPQTAVRATSSSVARRVRAAGCHGRAQTIVRMIVLPLGADWPPSRLWRPDEVEELHRSGYSFSTLKPRSVSVFSASSSGCADDVGHLRP